MIKLLIKHTITEYCINVLFDNIYNNFYPLPKVQLYNWGITNKEYDLLIYQQYVLPLIHRTFPILITSTPMGSNEFINKYFNK